MPAQSDAEHFARLIDALHPWLDEVAIIGGWAHRLYRLHALTQPLNYEPLGTFDTDVAVPAELSVADTDLRHRLMESDFREELLGDTKPPVAHYYVANDKSGFYAEFLTPLMGGYIKRDGKRDETATIAGVAVQKLRHLELLLHAPWEVTISAANGYPTAEERRVRIPNVAAFLAQKILVHNKRDRADKAKDILYVHDTFEAFGGNLPAAREAWQARVKPILHPKTAREVEDASKAYFERVDDNIREAARIAVGRNLSPEALCEVCRYGWTQVFV